MGLKQSSQAEGVRVRSYSDATGGPGRAAVLRYYAGSPAAQFGERIQYPSPTSRSFIPSSGRRAETDGQRALLIGSLPAHLSPHLLPAGFHCPMCTKFVCSDEIDVHLLMCFSKPRLHYNEDVLSRDCGECSICLDDMLQGDTIARLPCLCIYHKGCIDEWFEVNRLCPEHPTD
ncbi:E3 ubiquitin-protein ligase znrf2-like isoform X1 [Triplophysa dalaica]|uniref:E3 ubiquitin-protein ligase znrf2-like isoform X1 n=1 Tax=Triplophysa dalaica TaxID=1582913 RepID=UPI0024DF60EB|nr:E3 ubiquitin-protein ligase znrf2-like isoform X1 [Triplophysa dalaica]